MSNKRKRLLNWAKHQQRWFGKWHLYLGIFAGLIVSIVGVTGSILVYQDDIDEALNPSLFRVVAQQRKMPFDEIVPLIHRKYPALKFGYIMNEEDKPMAAYHLYNFAAEEEIFINPYTAEISGKRIYESSFIHIITDIHRTLLIPTAGRYIVGISSLILLILTITGLRLWIPAKWKQLKSVLTVNFKMSWKRQNLDWHNVLGFYSAPVVSLMALTGVCITFSNIVIPMLFVLSGKSPQGVIQLLGAKSTYTRGATPAPLSSLVAVAYDAMPGSRIGGMALPQDSVGNYRFDMVSPELPRSGKREMLILDQYSGKILLNSRKDFPNVGNAYLSWMTPIHFGSFGGRPTQALAVVAGLMPLALFITGFIIWWPRYKKQKRSEKKKAAKKLSVAGDGEIEHIASAVDEGVAHEDRRNVGRGITANEKMAINEKAAINEKVAEVEVSDEDDDMDQAEIVRISLGKYILTHLKKGFQYAWWFVLIGAVMGALYGMFSGILIQPAVFVILFATVFVVLNFIVALISLLFYLLFMAPFKVKGRPVWKYFAFSLSFLGVFLLCYFLLANTGLHIF